MSEITRKQEDAEYFAEIETNLSEVYDTTTIVKEWIHNKEQFIHDIMDLIKASYEAGYDSALYDGQKALRSLEY